MFGQPCTSPKEQPVTGGGSGPFAWLGTTSGGTGLMLAVLVVQLCSLVAGTVWRICGRPMCLGLAYAAGLHAEAQVAPAGAASAEMTWDAAKEVRGLRLGSYAIQEQPGFHGMGKLIDEDGGQAKPQRGQDAPTAAAAGSAEDASKDSRRDSGSVSSRDSCLGSSEGPAAQPHDARDASIPAGDSKAAAEGASAQPRAEEAPRVAEASVRREEAAGTPRQPQDEEKTAQPQAEEAYSKTKQSADLTKELAESSGRATPQPVVAPVESDTRSPSKHATAAEMSAQPQADDAKAEAGTAVREEEADKTSRRPSRASRNPCPSEPSQGATPQPALAPAESRPEETPKQAVEELS